MKSHELARILLEQPNLPVATHANNHTYSSEQYSDYNSKLKVGILEHGNGPQHIVIGNLSKRNLNKPNYYVSQMILGDAPEEW